VAKIALFHVRAPLQFFFAFAAWHIPSTNPDHDLLSRGMYLLSAA
jgi:hypothetical protein